MKKLLSVILALAMIMSAMGTVVFAEESAVATVDGTPYTSLAEAVNNADGKTIVLVDDVTLENTLTIGANLEVTLDLNGKKISQKKEQTEAYQMILNDGKLTIKDSLATGKISYEDLGNGGEYISDTIYNRGTLVINGGTIENLSSETVVSNGYPHAVDTYSGIRDTSVTINGGTIYCENYSAIRMFCSSKTYKADLVINDGATIKGAVDMQNGVKEAALGSLTINGGTFEKTANPSNIRFANWNGGATEYGITAEIKGGSFDGGISKTYVPDAANWNDKIIKGGTFTNDVSAFVAEGYKLNDNGEVIVDSSNAIPEAEVTLLPRMTLTAEEHNYQVWNGSLSTGVENLPLEIVMNFKAIDTVEQAEAKGYSKWLTDFYLTVDGLATGSIVADNCYLAGNYGTFGWIVIPTDGLVIEEGVEYPVVSGYDATLNYNDICKSVKDFTAAIHIDQDIIDANPDMTVTLELKMTNPDDPSDVLEIGEPATYTAEDLATKEDTVIEMDDPEVELCDDGYYRCIKDGVVQTGWVTTNAGYRYYFSKSAAKYGAAMIGKNIRVGSQYYDFYVDGRLIESYEEDGTPILYKYKNGFITEDGITRYYVDNEYLIGWQYIEGYKYYFSKGTGAMLSGTNQIGHLSYNLDENGRWIGYYQTPYTEEESPKATEVVKDADGKYRYYVDGVAYEGWKVLPGADGYYKYYFSKVDGSAITTYGTQIGAEFFDFRPTGTLIKVDYVDGNAVMSDYVLSPEQGAKNGLTLDEDGKYRYYIDGEYQTGVITVDGYKYIFKSTDGAAATSADYQDENGYRRGSCYYQLTEDGKIISKKLI